MDNNINCSFLHRSHLVAKLIFLDQFCEISPYLPRSSLELHVPYAILRSIYSQYYTSSPSTPLALIGASPSHSPAVSMSHSSPAVRYPRGDSTPQSSANDSGHFKGSSIHSQDQAYYDADGGSSKNRAGRRSGPLEYSSSRKVKFTEGSTSGSSSRGPSPLPRFAVSRSGPLAYK